MTSMDDMPQPTAGGAFASILVAVDGSRQSAMALAAAMRFRFERLVVFRAGTERGEDEPSTDDSSVGRWWRRRHEDAFRDIQRQVEELSIDPATVEIVARQGDPAEEIVAEARHHELVVMGTSGRGAAGRLLFGSTSDRVMRHSETPVLLVRGSEDTTFTDAFGRVVVPLDGSDLAETAVPVAARVVAMLGAQLHLVRAVGMEEVLQTLRDYRPESLAPSYEEGDDPYETARKSTDAQAREYLDKVSGRVGAAGIPVTSELLSGTAIFELLQIVEPQDLVIMTSRGQGGWKRWSVGSVAEKMVREAKAPVLLVPTREDSQPDPA